MTEPEYFITDSTGKQHKVLEVFESFTGWYWYITEYDPEDKDVGFGFVQGFEDEWGNIDLAELRSNDLVWPVPKQNWAWTGRGCPMKTKD